MDIMMNVWRSEGNLWELVLSFHPVGSWDQTHTRFSDRGLGLLNDLN